MACRHLGYVSSVVVLSFRVHRLFLWAVGFGKLVSGDLGLPEARDSVKGSLKGSFKGSFEGSFVCS